MSPLGERLLPLWVVGFLMGGASLVQLLLDVPAGRLLDRYGYRKLLTLTMLIFFLGALADRLEKKKLVFFSVQASICSSFCSGSWPRRGMSWRTYPFGPGFMALIVNTRTMEPSHKSLICLRISAG